MIEIDWPRAWHGFVRGKLRIVTVNKATSALLTGEGQMRFAGPFAEYWSLSLTSQPLDRHKSRDIAAFLARLDGNIAVIKMYPPMFGCLPRGIAAGGASWQNPPASAGLGEPFSDATRFSDGTGFLDGSDFANVHAAQHAGSRYVTLSGLVPGEAVCLDLNDHFSIRHADHTGGTMEYLYQAVSVSSSDENGMARVHIRPSLRLDVRAGDIVNFNHPRSRFRLANPEAATLEVDGNGYASFALDLVEVLP